MHTILKTIFSQNKKIMFDQTICSFSLFTGKNHFSFSLLITLKIKKIIKQFLLINKFYISENVLYFQSIKIWVFISNINDGRSTEK